MLNLTEYRQRPNRLADYLPWAALVAPGVVLNKDGSFQRTVRYRGPDLDSATEAELAAAAARLNHALKRLRGGWALFAEALRRPSAHYPRSSWPNRLCALLDEERRALFEQEGAHYESDYYLTFVCLPAPETQQRVARWLFERRAPRGADYRVELDTFCGEVDRIIDLLRGVFVEVDYLTDDETLTYLHQTISERRHPVHTPEVPMYLDTVLADTPLLGGVSPQLGRLHLRTVSLLSFPASSTPGLLDELNRLAIDYRWVTRYLPLEKADALREMTKYRRRWFAKRKGVAALLKEAVTGHESLLGDNDAVNKAMDTDAALQEVAGDEVAFGYVTTTVTVWDEDPGRVEQKVRAIERVINGRGFTCLRESLNAVEAWLGSLPGLCRPNVRRPLLGTGNLAHLLPASAVWAAPEQDAHLGGPPLLHAVTAGSTPFRFVLHVGDVGHTMVIGPTGSGKSVLLALMAAQFLRYPEAQVYLFDKGGSARTITACAGGNFYELGGQRSALAFQPLAQIDDEHERGWAFEWVLDLLRQEQVPLTPEVKDAVWTALSSLATAPSPHRTLTGLVSLLQHTALRQALHPYTIAGAHGALLDAEQDGLAYAAWQCFEMEELMHLPSVVRPVLSYLFHRLEHRFTGRPTLLVLDEVWVFLDDTQFAAKLREWLKTLRKANVSVVFATQSLADIAQSAIVATLIESCPTRVFLANPKALEAATAGLYRQFGLNERQLEILGIAQPKRHYYYQTSLGTRLFELGLGPLALACCAASSKADQALVRELLTQHGPDGFAAAFLRAKGLAWAADLLAGPTTNGGSHDRTHPDRQSAGR